MRLMVDVRTMASQPSGVGMYVYNFIREVQKCPAIELILISDVDESFQMQEMKQSDVRIILYGKRIFRSKEVFRYFSFVKKEVLREQPDLFWEPNNLLPTNLKGFRGKVMLTLHDVFPITHAKYFNRLYPLYFRIFLKYSIRNSDILLFNSEETRKNVEKYVPLAKEKETFLTYVIVPDGTTETVKGDKTTDIVVDDKTTNFATDDKTADTTSDDKIAENNDYFFYIGNLEGRKGVDRLLKAYQQYFLQGGKRKLYLAGGIKDDYIRDLIAQVQKIVGPNLISLGYVEQEEKNRLIRQGGCFLFPSRAEGFGIPLIEVMQYKVPIIASDMSIFREIIGDCIYYYQQGSDEKEEITNLAKALQLFDKGCIRIDEQCYEKVVERYSPEVLGNAFIQYLNAYN